MYGDDDHYKHVAVSPDPMLELGENEELVGDELGRR